MPFSNPSILQLATHVAFHTFTTERLMKMGARSVVRVADNLILGPCRLDAEDHTRMRTASWGWDETWDRLYSPDVLWEPPVVVWVSANPKSA